MSLVLTLKPVGVLCITTYYYIVLQDFLTEFRKMDASLLCFSILQPALLTGSVGRETYLYTGNPARPKAQRSSGKQLFYQEVNYCMRQKRLNGLVDRNTAVHSSSFLGGRIFLQIGERENSNTNHF